MDQDKLQFMVQTPQQYIMSKRMDLARQLLKKINMSLCEIVESTGLYDVAHLSKNFNRFYSTTPSRYRKSVRDIVENERKITNTKRASATTRSFCIFKIDQQH